MSLPDRCTAERDGVRCRLSGSHSDHLYKLAGKLVFEPNPEFRSPRPDDLKALAQRVAPETRSDPVPDYMGPQITDLVVERDSHRGRMLAAYASRPEGLTDEQAGDLAGIPTRSTPWKRSVELRKVGYIVPMGEMRVTKSATMARVCAITERGREQMRGW